MEISINVPTSLSEISLKKYQSFIAMEENSNDDEFVAQKMIEIFCDITLKDIVKIKLKSRDELITHFSELFQTKPKFQHRFKLGDVEYGFIPELEEISLGEYIDLESNMNDWPSFHKAMAVMYRPITISRGEKYDIEEYNPTPEKQELMKYAPIDVCLAASLFFWNLGNALFPATLNYMQNEMTKNPKAMRTFQKQLNLPNDGDGISQYMHSLKETFLNSMRLPSYDLLNASRFLPSKRKKAKLSDVN